MISRRAKALIDDIVSRGHESPNGQPGSMHEMIIPAGKAGLIIGRGGETIKQLQVRLIDITIELWGGKLEWGNSAAVSNSATVVYLLSVI